MDGDKRHDSNRGAIDMLIKELNHLDNNLIKEIQELELICKDFDGLNGTIFLDTTFNFNKDIKSNMR